ncbi:NAD(P)-dependent dehydrogenase (short-subunit alcohol dehydrogenase family) [Actinocorallia herbida]|uniref:NAD(P)-dependent dehydrogenase (Short-subunit alcohol dehydrogenase family) n=1 Tax=Actinocorallia herbida TaxID=58109 RepID=A0A3N1CZ70_9ACTN|nr:SDR family oxidoreductase [Actinocorallia herbida]ROO86591.1 NAD(P)-dependent dehydrogenase (short-subunit alcohol dehydrogenase family) [Actinocorallia herbida]
MADQVVVVIGTGGMGEAIARRVGSGTHLLLADFDAGVLEAAAARLSGEGQRVTTQLVDVTSRESVAALAKTAAGLGDVAKVVHTAGLSPVQAPVAAILAVDLLGVALVLDEFGTIVAEGAAGLVISSMAGHHMPALPPEDAALLATAPADDLLSLPLTDPAKFAGNSGFAYVFAKHANHLRVRAASSTWSRRGARVNSISPGVIATPMGMEELSGDSGDNMRAMIAASNAKRVGTPEDIATAAAFLLGPDATFISGTDLLVDGGATAGVTTPV